MAKIRTVLTSYNMGEVESHDFEMWVEFVGINLAEQVGFEVEVDSYRFGESAARDYVSGAWPDQENAIREALRSLWDDFCGGGWDAAYKARGLS